MASFFEKLKKGMGIEATEEVFEETTKKTKEEKEEVEEEEKVKEKLKRVPRERKNKKVEIKEIKLELIEKTPEEEKSQPEEKKEEIKLSPTKNIGEKETWLKESVGQLAVDVFQTDTDLVIQSTIAGVKPSDLDISIEGDVVIIKVIRTKPNGEISVNYFYQECYWGPFSREIILPCEVDPSRISATMKEGILTIRIPKIERERKRKIIVNG